LTGDLLNQPKLLSICDGSQGQEPIEQDRPGSWVQPLTGLARRPMHRATFVLAMLLINPIRDLRHRSAWAATKRPRGETSPVTPPGRESGPPEHCAGAFASL
jgi:hypothetical protein